MIPARLSVALSDGGSASHERWRIAVVFLAATFTYAFLATPGWATMRISRFEPSGTCCTATGLSRERRCLAEVDFVLPRALNHLDNRIWVDGQRAVTLERVELLSTGPDPPLR